MNPFETLFESDFSDGNHCFKWSCRISKDSQAFDTKHLTIAFNFRQLVMILLLKFFWVIRYLFCALNDVVPYYERRIVHELNEQTLIYLCQIRCHVRFAITQNYSCKTLQLLLFAGIFA